MAFKNIEEEIKWVENLTEEVCGGIYPIEAKLLYFLARYGKAKGKIVEIGSYQGYSTIWLGWASKFGKKEKVYAIDPQNTIDLGNNESIFRENMRKAQIDDYVIPLIMTSTEAAKDWKEPIRLLWIDGAHDYENVRNDFLLWERHLVYGGIIAFHDFCLIVCPGVTKVVKEYIFDSDKFSNIGYVGTTIYAKKVKKISLFERLKKEALLSLLFPRENAEIILQEGKTLFDQGRHEEAEKIFEKIERDLYIILPPEYRICTSHFFADFYREIGACGKAEEIYQKILSFSEKRIPRIIKNPALINLGEIYLSRQDHAKAEEKFSEVLSQKGFTNIQRARAIFGLGNLYLQRGEFRKAEEEFKEALSLEPQDKNIIISIHYALGSLYERKGDFNRAKEKFEEIVGSIEILSLTTSRDKFLGGAQFHLGCIYKELGKEKEAKHYFEECLKFIPGHKKAKEYLELAADD
ncbi:MAG: tetratricopeptide repeat protein [bacterium]|nr:tetratricopeptide repeat protein [bacterium]